MVKNLSCNSCTYRLKRFPHKFTTAMYYQINPSTSFSSISFFGELKAGSSEEKLGLMPCLSNVLF
jgi:hypothetical protein